MKIFISVPMKDKTDEEIKKEISIVRSVAKAYFVEENVLGTLEFVDNFKGIPDGVVNFISFSETKQIPEDENRKALYCLGEALQKMSNCDAIMSPFHWEHYIDCNLEFDAANKYGLKHYFYDDRIFDKSMYIATDGIHVNSSLRPF